MQEKLTTVNTWLLTILELNLLHNIHRSWMFILVFVLTAVVQVLLVEIDSILPFARGVPGKITKTVPLDWRHWLVSLGVGFGSIPVSLLTRIIVRLLQCLFQKKAIPSEPAVNQQRKEQYELKEEKPVMQNN